MEHQLARQRMAECFERLVAERGDGVLTKEEAISYVSRHWVRKACQCPNKSQEAAIITRIAESDSFGSRWKKPLMAPKKPATTTDPSQSSYKEVEVLWQCSEKPKEILDYFVGQDRILSELLKCSTGLSLGEEKPFWKDARPVQNILIVGDRGSGRTCLGRRIAACLSDGVKYIEVSGKRLLCLSKQEEELKSLFDLIRNSSPCFVFFDDLDTFLPARSDDANNTRAFQRSLSVHRFCSLMQSLESYPVWCLASAEAICNLDSEVMCADVFRLAEYRLAPLTCQERAQLIKLHLRRRWPKGIDTALVETHAQLTEGWLPRDLVRFVKEAVMQAFLRQPSMPSSLDINHPVIVDLAASETTIDVETSAPDVEVTLERGDFEKAFSLLKSRTVKEGFSEIPTVTMKDIGGYQEAKDFVQRRIVSKVVKAHLYERANLHDPSGLLLWGPPGCGKTLLAKAIANACGARFVYVSSSEFLNKYVGDSEKKVHLTFERARTNTPCLIFFDEFDAICPNRADEGQHEVSKRVVNCLLSEMDGVKDRRGIFVIAATNRRESLDPAMLRSGRLQHSIFLPPPDAEARLDILRTVLEQREWKIESDSFLQEIVQRTEGFSGANLTQLLCDGAQIAIDELLDQEGSLTPIKLKLHHVLSEIDAIRSHISDEQFLAYKQVSQPEPPVHDLM